MTSPSTTPVAAHDRFTLERNLAAPPPRVFDAWSTPDGKAAWFIGPAGWAAIERSMDFRVGGREILCGRGASGTVSRFEATYFNIVRDRRIVYAYAMSLDDRLISISLATIEFQPDGEGTRLLVTEQGAFLDGYDDAGSRERGTGSLMDALARSIAVG